MAMKNNIFNVQQSKPVESLRGRHQVQRDASVIRRIMARKAIRELIEELQLDADEARQLLDDVINGTDEPIPETEMINDRSLCTECKIEPRDGKYTKCRKCNRFNTCVDCGGKIDRYATRCIECNRKELVRIRLQKKAFYHE